MSTHDSAEPNDSVVGDSTPPLQDPQAPIRSEEKYRTLFEAIDEGFAIVEVLPDQQGCVTDLIYREANPAFERHSGMRDFVGKKVSTILPHLEQHWLDLLTQVYQTGEPTRTEQHIAELGRWLHVYYSRVGGAGSPLVAVVFNDITERKRRETNLAFLAELSQELVRMTRPEETLAVLGSSIGAHFNSVRVSFVEIFADQNRAVVRDWHGPDLSSVAGHYPLSQFLGEPYRQLSRAGQPIVIRDAYQSDLVDGPQLEAVFGVVSFINIPLVRDGHWVFTLGIHDTVPRAWQADEIDLLQELAGRIWARLEKVRAEEALRASQKRFESIANLVPDLLWDSGPDGTTNWYNQRWLEYTGQRSDEAINWGWTDAVHPDDRDTSAQRYREAVAAGIPLRQEHRIRRYDGVYRWFVVSVSPLKDATGQVVKMYGAATDIHESKRLEMTLRETHRRKDEFLAMLAHELRNPISTLHNTLLLLTMTRGQDESLSLDKAFAMMSREVTHLNRMVDDLLDVSRISQGKIYLKRERLNLSGLLRAALEAARSKFTSQGQALTVHLPSGPVWVDGDRTRLTQVIRNLTTNAAKFTPPGGQIEVRLEKENGQAVVRIRDSGLGLAPDQFQAIFEVFVQISSSLDRPQGGLGLGLAVVKQLVELHGGQVGVSSPGLGQGSEFTVALPLLPDTPSLFVDTGDEPASQSGRILVVDDNEDLALTTALLLRVKRYEAHTCLSGAEALKVVASLQPDAVLLDLGMPDMDGYETCRRLRALDWGKQGVIVALSGYGQEDDRKRTRETGFDGHLIKPVDLQALTELLDKLLNSNKSGH